MAKTMMKFLAALLLVTALIPVVQAGDRAISRDYPLTRLTDKVYVIHGPNEEVSRENQAFRNNPVLVLTSLGVVVVDPGSSLYIGEMIVKKIRTLTDKPVVAVFNTHGHGDHWLGNHGIRKHYPDVVIYGHQAMINGINNGEGAMWIDAINKRSDGAIEGTRVIAPSKPVKGGDSIRIGDITFEVIDPGKAHSDSDLMLHLKEEQVLVFGDTLRARNLSPFMASFKNNLAALDMGEKLEARFYIPGHGTTGGKEIIAEYRAFISDLKSEVKRHYDEGISDYEMKPRVLQALDKYKDWSGFDEYIGRLINLVYLEVETEEF